MATNNNMLAEDAEAMMLAKMNKKHEPAQPDPAPWQPVTGIRSDGAAAARRTIGKA